MVRSKKSNMIKKIKEHLEGDIKGFDHEKKEDKELLKRMKKKKRNKK